MPVMFIGHGSPMNVIEDTVYRQSWQALGTQFGTTWPRPQLILCVSAHWLTRGWWLTSMSKPKTIHDFGGFPAKLFAQQYPVPGFPWAAVELAQALRNPSSGEAINLDPDQWGLDHGAWGVLKPMFPAADIPVVQLSMDASQPASSHLALGKQLKTLRDWGVLLLALQCGDGDLHAAIMRGFGTGVLAPELRADIEAGLARHHIVEQGRQQAHDAAQASIFALNSLPASEPREFLKHLTLKLSGV